MTIYQVDDKMPMIGIIFQKVELEAEIFQCRKGLRELCAKERNKYSKRAIRKDFEAGMKVFV